MIYLTVGLVTKMADVGLINVTGWTQIQSGNIINGVFSMYDAALFGWLVVILFFTFQLISLIKVKSPLLSWAIGLLFTGLYFASGKLGAIAIFNPLAMNILFITLAFETAILIFGWLANR